MTTGIIIPLYMYPNAAWLSVRAQKILHPSVPVVAIINPNNGVGSIIDPTIHTGTLNLQSAGVVVLGYVATGYGGKSLAQVVAECVNYVSWYHTDGIFFDEWQSGWVPPPNIPGLLIGNPGTSSAPAAFPLITYETGGMPPANFTGNYIAHTVPTLPATFPRPAWIYITDDPATYMVLPSYFVAEMTALDTGVAPPPPPPPPPPTANTITLTVGGKNYIWSVTTV